MFPEVEGLDPEHLDDVARPRGGGDVATPSPSTSRTLSHELGRRPGLTDLQLDVFEIGRKAYEKGLDALKARLPGDTLLRLESGWKEIEAVTDCWASTAADLLRQIKTSAFAGEAEVAVVHVIVTRGEIINGAARSLSNYKIIQLDPPSHT